MTKQQAFDNFFDSVLHGIGERFDIERKRIEQFNEGYHISELPPDIVLTLADQIETVKRLNRPQSGGYDSTDFDRQADIFIRAALKRPTVKSAPHKIHIIDGDL
jgi:hypothetical protein